jgi:plastocyanin
MIRRLALSLILTFAACAKSEETAPSSAPANSSAPTATTAVVSGKATSGSVVTLTSSAAPDYPLPPGPAVMDQLGKQFVPELLMVRVGQPVEFRNSEDMEHNVIVVRSRTGRSVFNASPPPFQKHVHTFAEPGMYLVSCDIHPGMRATVVATTTPYAVVADPSGRFSFTDVPPGSYKLTMLADRADVERTIEVSLPKTEVAVEK